MFPVCLGKNELRYHEIYRTNGTYNIESIQHGSLVCSLLYSMWKCMVWTLGDVLVDVLDTSKEVGTILNIHMASKKHGEMRIIRNHMLIGEGLLILGIMSLDCVGKPILWSSIQRILVFIHYSLWTECLWESFGTLSLWIQTSLGRALMDHL